jgi:hypothetical protein
LSDDELIAKLVESAKAAILNERPGLTYDRARLKGVTVELTVANNGNVVNGQVYLQRSVNLTKLLKQGPPVPVGAGEG